MDYVSSTLSAFNVNEDTLPLTFTVIIDDSKVVDIILAPIKESCLANHSYKSHKGIFAATKTYYLTVKSLGKHTIYEYNSSFGVLSSSCSDYTTSTACSGCGDASGESYMCKWDTDSGTGTCKLDLDHTCPPEPSPTDRSCPIWQNCNQPIYSNSYEFTESSKKISGYDLCTTTGVYDDISKAPNKNVYPAQLAEAWITSTYDLKSPVDTDGQNILPVAGGLDSCVDAVTMSLGECTGQQAIQNICGNGGYWQVSNWSKNECTESPLKQHCDKCGGVDLLDPCCAAPAAYIHAGEGCIDGKTSGATNLPKCDITRMHGPCWAGPLCVSGQDDSTLVLIPKYNPDPKDPTKVFSNPTKIAGWNNSWWYYSLYPGVTPNSYSDFPSPPHNPPPWPCTKENAVCSKTKSDKSYKYKDWYYKFTGNGNDHVTTQPQTIPMYTIAQNACETAIKTLITKKILKAK